MFDNVEDYKLVTGHPEGVEKQVKALLKSKDNWILSCAPYKILSMGVEVIIQPMIRIKES